MADNQSVKKLLIKIDVDTDRGTRIGIPNLLNLFNSLNIAATFLFSLGPDRTGRAIKRIFRPGFLKKVGRSSIISIYGVRTLLNGTLLASPHIGRRNQAIMQAAHMAGHEVGIHCYDHIRWQDGLASMSKEEVFAEFQHARDEFERIFGFPAKTAGAAGWQANVLSFEAYDAAQLLYGSDVRSSFPFFPRIGDKVFSTLQIPTTLPTFDELIGRPEYPLAHLGDFYLQQLKGDQPNILTAHAEIEGMKYLSWFKEFLSRAQAEKIHFMKLEDLANTYLANKAAIPICEVTQKTIDGRSGTLAMQEQSL